MAEMSGKQALMEQLAAEGVEYVFGNPGTTEQPFMDILQDYPQIQYILALQEASALGMADAYAWACGRPAFVQLHAAPGLGNAMGMLYNQGVFVGKHILKGGIIRHRNSNIHRRWPSFSQIFSYHHGFCFFLV